MCILSVTFVVRSVPGGIYTDDAGPFGDNQFRYALLSLAACEAPLVLNIGGYRYSTASEPLLKLLSLNISRAVTCDVNSFRLRANLTAIRNFLFCLRVLKLEPQIIPDHICER